MASKSPFTNSSILTVGWILIKYASDLQLGSRDSASPVEQTARRRMAGIRGIEFRNRGGDMCFFIAGVQPRRRTLDAKPQRCPRCGLHQAYVQRIDHYISLFFIPLVRVKQGDPFLYCQRCEQPVDTQPEQPAAASSDDRQPETCRQCGRRLEASFKYCPYCGQRR